MNMRPIVLSRQVQMVVSKQKHQFTERIKILCRICGRTFSMIYDHRLIMNRAQCPECCNSLDVSINKQGEIKIML